MKPLSVALMGIGMFGLAAMGACLSLIHISEPTRPY